VRGEGGAGAATWLSSKTSCPAGVVPAGHAPVPCLDVPLCPAVATVDDFTVIAAPDNSTSIGHREVRAFHALHAFTHTHTHTNDRCGLHVEWQCAMLRCQDTRTENTSVVMCLLHSQYHRTLQGLGMQSPSLRMCRASQKCSDLMSHVIRAACDSA
jgi:hypothetical protein